MIQVKRKRGRPKKTVITIKDNPSMILNICNTNLDKTNAIADLEPNTFGKPKVIKRGRGSSKQNKVILTNFQTQPTVSYFGAKKIKRTKLNNHFTIVKNRKRKLLKTQSNSDKSEENEESSRKSSNASSSSVVILPKHDYKLMYVPFAELGIFEATLLISRIILKRCDNLIPKIPLVTVEKCNKIIEKEKSITLETCYSLQNNTECKNTVNVDYSLLTPRIILKRLDVQENTDSESFSDPEISKGINRRSARLNKKLKDNEMVEEELLMPEDQKVDYSQIADEIRQEHEKQLLKLRIHDRELDKKLKNSNFKLINNNLFRPNKKKMSEYTPAEAQELRKLKPKITSMEYDKCQCNYSKQDYIQKKPGCLFNCTNQSIYIECTWQCPSKEFCTNKQFQNKQFKRTEIVKTPDKGYGVFALEDIASETFIDEFMGEVIDQKQMLKRINKKSYRNNNYMMKLTRDEIIDATRKGNITRFINHSCEPNCRAEKWTVLDESRMGFFSKKFIQKGEEITFDYGYEIFGDTTQEKCYCGTPKCRGFISKKSRAFHRT